MFGPASKAFTAFAGGLVSVLGLVLSASIVHGRWAAYIAVAIAVVTMVAQTVAVFKVPNTEANVVTDTKSVIAEVPVAKALVAQIGADLHAGAAQKAPWPAPTATPPVPTA